MTAAALTADRALAVPRTQERIVTGLFFASLFVATFEKVHWNVAGQIGLNDITTILFLIAYVATERRPLPRTSAIVLGFFAAFALVYLAGYWNIDTQQGLTQFTKGMVKFVIHFAFLVAAIGYLAQRGETLLLAGARLVHRRLRGERRLRDPPARLPARGPQPRQPSPQPAHGRRGRHQHLRRDRRPEHLPGQRAHRRPEPPRRDADRAAARVDAPLPADAARCIASGGPWRLRSSSCFSWTSRRSRVAAGVGLIAGALVLVVPYRRFFRSKQFLYPLGAVVVVLLAVLYTHRHFFETFLRQRVSTQGSSANVHFAVYSFIGKVLHMHPLLGLGNNNFSVYYEFVTGKSNFGAHSYWVAVIVESGLLGLILWIVFLRYVFVRLLAARRLGRLLDRIGDPEARHVRPLAYGFTAALVGTIVANFFYLTIQFYYFYAFLAFALALPVVFGGRARGQPGG